MKYQTVLSGISLGPARNGLGIVCLLALGVGCGDNRDVAGPDPAPTTGALAVLISTTGTDMDSDGYILNISDTEGSRTQRVSGTDSLMIDRIRVGTLSVELTGVADNCWVAEGRRRRGVIEKNQLMSISFAVTCESLLSVQASAAALAGVWEAVSWEFFTGPELKSLLEDVIAGGIAGTLTVRNDGGQEIQWQWRETYRWWGPNRPTIVTGRAEIGAGSLRSMVDSVATEFECDWGDCEGPLHGEHRFAMTASRLVITREAPVRYDGFFESHEAWVRLVLERVP